MCIFLMAAEAHLKNSFQKYTIELGFHTVCWSHMLPSHLHLCVVPSPIGSQVTKFPVHPAEAHKALTSCTSLLAGLVQERGEIWM